MRIALSAPALLILSACSGGTEEQTADDQGSDRPNETQIDSLGAQDTIKRPRPEVISAGTQFDCNPIRVWDGDGPIWCEEGARVRLAGIAAREIDETCRDGHPCPAAGGIEARDILVGLVGTPVGSSSEGHILVEGEILSCYSEGSALGNRTSAWCISPDSGDLSCEMVKRGAALRWEKHWGDHKCPA